MTTVTATGPVFDGRAAVAMTNLEREATEKLAKEGVDEVRLQLDRVLINPTGFYKRQIRAQKKESSRQEVTDGGVVYGPWLAGVGSRNQTSRFKGYTHWRRATQKLQRDAVKIVQPVTTRQVRKMN